MARSTSTSPGLSITIDVEDHETGSGERRFTSAISPLIDALDAIGVPATFFVVGSLADSWSAEMRDVVSRGHEVGLHGFTHRHLKALGPLGFADELQRGRERLGDILGAPPKGFRAPYFSLTRATPWAPELIVGAGFTYSSSVLPAWNPQAGLPGAPRRPFRWDCGLIEFPSPVFGVGRFRVPLLGGAYLRLAPAPLVRVAEHVGRDLPGRWTYSHPYDFDVDEPFARRDGQAWWFAKLLFARRRLMLDRVTKMAGTQSSTLGAFAADPAFTAALPSYSIPTN